MCLDGAADSSLRGELEAALSDELLFTANYLRIVAPDLPQIDPFSSVRASVITDATTHIVCLIREPELHDLPHSSPLLVPRQHARKDQTIPSSTALKIVIVAATRILYYVP